MVEKYRWCKQKKRLKNEGIKLDLNQMDTVVQKRRRLQWFGHVKRIDYTSQYQIKLTRCQPKAMVPGTEKDERTLHFTLRRNF